MRGASTTECSCILRRRDEADGLTPPSWTEDAKRAYRPRAGLCEVVNAHQSSSRDRSSLGSLGGKVTCVALLGALANKFLAHATPLLG